MLVVLLVLVLTVFFVTPSLEFVEETLLTLLVAEELGEEPEDLEAVVAVAGAFTFLLPVEAFELEAVLLLVLLVEDALGFFFWREVLAFFFTFRSLDTRSIALCIEALLSTLPTLVVSAPLSFIDAIAGFRTLLVAGAAVVPAMMQYYFGLWMQYYFAYINMILCFDNEVG